MAKKNQVTTTNGTTAVVVVDTPASGKTRSVGPKMLFIENKDSASRTYTVRFNDGSTTIILETSGAIASGGSFTWSKFITLTAGDTLEVLVDATAATTESEVLVSFIEE